MRFIAVKNDRRIELKNDVQAAAFINSDWQVTEIEELPPIQTSYDHNQPSLSDLQKIAREHDISFHPTIGYEKLAAKLQEAGLM